MTPRQLLRDATARLRAAGCESPRLDAEVLLMHAAGMDRVRLIVEMDRPLEEDAVARFAAHVERRARREPVAYICGEKEFFSRLFAVDARVLIPRPETEHLVETLLEVFPDWRAAYRFCDIGTGSGAIAVTVACAYPNAAVVATDLSPDALGLARVNAERHGAIGRIRFREGEMFDAIAGEALFDAILSNPPYVSRAEYGELEPELGFEPRGALTDEGDGLTCLRALVDGAARWLRPGGALIVETGPCGLPPASAGMWLEREIHDLAGALRAGLYRRRTPEQDAAADREE